jgi:hypothetical protein
MRPRVARLARHTPSGRVGEVLDAALEFVGGVPEERIQLGYPTGQREWVPVAATEPLEDG